MTPDPEPNLPIFLPEWSVWDTVITHHYEETSKNAKDFMYELALKNVDRPIKLSIIPNELKRALTAVFGDRHAFDFLMENCAATEPIPDILTRAIGEEIPHRVAVVFLGFWKSFSFSEVYIVTQDPTLNEEFLKGMDKMGINLSHLHIIDTTEALRILREKC